MFNYETIIGIEVHVELNTEHKIFSPSINDINAKPNTNIHPIDIGLPGTLPRFNEEVLKKAVIVADAFEMDITKDMHWDRKNYFYPDNPKGYQITQNLTPIGRNGKITLDSGKVIEIEFMHMEEDTAKSFHVGDETLLDFNRCGVPLLEIVSKCQMRSGSEAREYLEKLREILLYVDASDCKMEEGSLRVDVNISIRPFGQEELNTKVEIKNLNSFTNVENAIIEEVKNQTLALNTDTKVYQATKRFNEGTKKVDLMRIKETKADYHFFPEPDLPPISIDDAYIQNIVKDAPVKPIELRTRFTNLGLNASEVDLIMADREMARFYDHCVDENIDYKQLFNYLSTYVTEYMKKNKVSFKDIYLTMEHLIDLDAALTKQTISTNHVKQIFPEVLKTNDSIASIIAKFGLEQIVDPEVIRAIIKDVLANNAESVELYKSGKQKAFGFMIGLIMKASKGQANPVIVNKVLKEELDND